VFLGSIHIHLFRHFWHTIGKKLSDALYDIRRTINHCY